MKKAFISIYVLIVLLLVGLVVSFISRQNETNIDIASDLYNRKRAMYIALSESNIYLAQNKEKLISKINISNTERFTENRDGYEVRFNIIYKGLSETVHKSDLSIQSSVRINNSICTVYSYYNIQENNKLKLAYRRIQ